MTDESTQALPVGASDGASEIPAPQEVESTDNSPVDAGQEPEHTEGDEKPKGGFQRRIKSLVDERNEYRAMLAEERRQFAEVLSRLSPQQKSAEPTTPPTLEQSGFDEQKYQQAVIEYAKAEARKEAQEALRQEREQAQRATKVESFKSREESFADTVEDYHDVVYSETTPISPAMAEVIQESEIGPQLAYHLAKNTALARAIYSLPPVQAARELGKLEAKLSAPKPVATKAPPPPPRIEATEPAVEKDPDKMSDEEWLKWRNKQVSAARARSHIRR